jgi:hypothetical protein
MPAMKLLIQSAMIFFGTLMAAGLVALGEPARADRGAEVEAAARAFNQLLESASPWTDPSTPAEDGR